MKESREEYEKKITKEITHKLNLDENKLCSINEIKDLLEKHDLGCGMIQFVPIKALYAKELIEGLVHMNMKITDSIHEEIGIYEDKGKCDYCGNYFLQDNMFQVSNISGCPYLCEECRRKNKIKINLTDFRTRIKKEDGKKFIEEELKYGIDYSDYIKKSTNL